MLITAWVQEASNIFTAFPEKKIQCNSVECFFIENEKWEMGIKMCSGDLFLHKVMYQDFA